MMGIGQADDSDDEQSKKATETTSTAETRRKGGLTALSSIRWSDVKFQSDGSSTDSSETNKMASPDENTSDDEDLQQVDLEFDVQGDQFFQKEKLYGSTRSNTRSRITVRGMLDKWDEPVVKHGKVRRTNALLFIAILLRLTTSNICLIFYS